VRSSTCLYATTAFVPANAPSPSSNMCGTNAERIGRSDQGTHHRCRGVRKGPNYDTNVDHIVRTAATELRKRLATYYVTKAPLRAAHRAGARLLCSQIRASGSGPPHSHRPRSGSDRSWFETHSAHIQFGPLPLAGNTAAAKETPHWGRRSWGLLLIAAFALAVALDIAGCTKPIPKTCSGGRSSTHRARFLWPSEITERPSHSARRRWRQQHRHPGSQLGFVADGAFCRYVTIARVWGARSPEQAGPHSQGQLQLVFRSPRSAVCLLAPSIMNGVCVLPASSVTAWPWTPTGTLSIFGTRKTRITQLELGHQSASGAGHGRQQSQVAGLSP